MPILQSLPSVCLANCITLHTSQSKTEKKNKIDKNCTPPTAPTKTTPIHPKFLSKKETSTTKKQAQKKMLPSSNYTIYKNKHMLPVTLPETNIAG